MKGQVKVEIRAGAGEQPDVAVLWFENGPVNTLTAEVRRDLLLQLDNLETAEIAALVLAGRGKSFSSGLDLAELEGPTQDPTVMELCSRLADFPKPVIAALKGAVLGAGVDLAVAAHGRVAAPGTHFGFPAMALGLLPLGGATQRLIEVLDGPRALRLLQGLGMYDVDAPELMGLVDEVARDGPVVEHALALARLWADHPEQWQAAKARQAAARDPLGFQAAIQSARTKAEKAKDPSAQRLVDCLEASLLLPREAGLAYEATAAEECRISDYSSGMRYAQKARRRASKFPERQQAEAQEVTQLGLIGGGNTAASIAVLAARAGLKVAVFERNDSTVGEAQARITRLAAKSAGRGDTAQLTDAISVSSDLGALSQAQAVLETVAENLETKRQIFSALDAALPPEALRLSQSPLLSIADMAAGLAHPETFLGMHFHGPVLRAELVELMPGPETAAEALVTAADLVSRLGRIAVRAGTGGGTIGQSIMAALHEAGWYFILQGISPYEVDRVLVDFGLPLGLFGALDRFGLARAEARLALLHNRDSYPHTHATLLRLMLQHGRGGKAEGRGFYLWEGEVPRPDPTLIDVLNDAQPWRSPPSDGEILKTLLAAGANQGARLLRSGAALRPSDIDAVMVLAHGFPRHRGGVLHAAERCGMFAILQDLKARAEEVPLLFDPEPGIAALVRDGRGFSDLNGIGRARQTLPE